LASGFSAVKSSLQETVDLITTVQKVITKLVKQINDIKPGGGGGGGGLLGGLGMGIAGLAGGGALAAAGKKGLGFAKFLSSKKSLALMGLGGIGAAAMGGSAAQAADVSTEERMLGTVSDGNMPPDQIALFNSTVSKFEKYLEDAKKKQRSGRGGGGKQGKPPRPPAPPGGAVDYSNLKSGDISTTAGKAATLYDEFRNLGYTDEAAKRIIAEVGREGSFSNKNLFGTHVDPKAGISNTGMFSWNDTRRDALIADAKKAGVWDEQKGQLKETPEALRFQARFADKEIKAMGAGIRESMTNASIKGSKISELLRDKVIRYDPNYAGGTSAEYGSVRTEDWYKKIAPGLEKTRRPSGVAQTQITQVAQLTQQQLGSMDPLDMAATYAQSPTGTAQQNLQSSFNIVPLPAAAASPPPAPKPNVPGVIFDWKNPCINSANTALTCSIYNINK
jgi:hypothetical protein